ncbi:MarR family winged helix-turn-helix transcriptional regulator [Bradyrhizobium sp. HKCCYLS2058]|uniref:MarR family winged helix-turn-helix transcriptional regulator n=1 Tax=Bradyrhizobium TaxID=374 RepID=UPI0028E2A414|nr:MULTISPECIES: MarR family winged helix-turn-helix transcriptional regulator [unclassified Bradyrhizobium]
MTKVANETRGRTNGEGAAEPELRLQRYFPYRLARLAEQVSLAVAEVYADRFALSRQEWRILAALGEQPRLPTKEIGRLTTLDKMNVSRAMQSLEARGIVSRSRDPADGRERIVALTAAGRGLYRRIVPHALAREADLLSVLSAAEIATLDTVIDKLLAAAERSVDDPPGRKA